MQLLSASMSGMIKDNSIPKYMQVRRGGGQESGSGKGGVFVAGPGLWAGPSGHVPISQNTHTSFHRSSAHHQSMAYAR